MTGELLIRPARFSQEHAPDHPLNKDVIQIWSLLQEYAKDQLLLPRPPEDILEKIRNFRIAETDGVFAGCAALRDYGNGLYEVRSLAVVQKYAGCRIGSRIVSSLIEQKRAEGLNVRLFALTYRVRFFQRLGFQIVDKKMFPGKIWSDCSVCSKKECCDETAVLLELKPHEPGGTAR